MARSAKSFGRGKPRFKAQPTVLVICEDSKSGKRYLDDATVHFRIQVVVEVAHCGKTDPKGIVTTALERQKSYDRVFCAIDRDTHQNFDEAIALAKTSEKIEVIASYPCLEFWYLLHFGYRRAPYIAAGSKSAGDMLVSDLRGCEGMGGYDKGAVASVFDALLPHLPQARHLAPKVLAKAHEEQNLNPSTRMHDLIDFFESLATPQEK